MFGVPINVICSVVCLVWELNASGSL